MQFILIPNPITKPNPNLGWWRGVVGNAFRLKQSYFTLGPVSTAMGDCLRLGNAIDFRVSREHKLKFLVIVLLYTSALATILNKKKLLTDSLALSSNKWPQL